MFICCRKTEAERLKDSAKPRACEPERERLESDHPVPPATLEEQSFWNFGGWGILQTPPGPL